MGDDRVERRNRAARRSETRRTHTQEELEALVELDARYTRVAVLAALEAVRRSARTGRRTA